MNVVALRSIAKDELACTGCAACTAACPTMAISMHPDAEGFLRPKINAEICTDCDLCRKICPVNRTNASENAPLERPERGRPLNVFAAWHLDEAIRHESSSGGVFTALAENILARGGVVAGAAFDDNLVVRHILVENTNDLHRLRGSKYVQSEIPLALYHQIRDRLKQGQLVFFSGTPCQVAGLTSFLGKSYANLFCCDIACHGVPSPLLLARYVRYNQARGEQLVKISFRDKAKGWKHSGIRRHLHNGESKFTAVFSDPFMSAFHRDYALRFSCYVCQFASSIRPGDLTIADFWGVAERYPEYDCDDKGTSLILVNTEKGRDWLEMSQQWLFLGPSDIETAISGNPVLVRPSPRAVERTTFYRDLNTISFSRLISKYRLGPPSLSRRIVRSVARRIVSTYRNAANLIIDNRKHDA
jgi:ferredoxin